MRVNRGSKKAKGRVTSTLQNGKSEVENPTARKRETETSSILMWWEKGNFWVTRLNGKNSRRRTKKYRKGGELRYGLIRGRRTTDLISGDLTEGIIRLDIGGEAQGQASLGRK